jgi:hypothetical protein
MPTLQSIQETDDLTLIGSVAVPPSSEEPHDHALTDDPMSALLADKISGASFLRKQQREDALEHERQLAAIRKGSDYAASGIDIASASPLLLAVMKAGPRPLPGVPEQPPLDPRTREGIDLRWHHLDRTHWPNLTAMRIKNYYLPDVPVPPQAPQRLLSLIQWYASMLFGTEADQYDQLRSDVRYGSWLAHLANRVWSHVLAALQRLENGDSDATIIAHHGLTLPKIEQAVRSALLEIRRQYEQGTAPSQHSIAAPPPPPEVQRQMEQAMPTPRLVEARRALWDAYRRTFPNVYIIDVCWAADQHRREWDRWLNGVKRDGSKPDRLFRSVLTSGKDARTLRQDERPKDWK